MDEIKIKLKKGQQAWITSDFHYNHKNIVAGTSAWKDKKDSCRPYRTVSEMNNNIVNRVNTLVRPDDWLIFLGDWSFGGIESIWELRKRLVVQNILFVLGNHDHHIRDNKILPNVVRETNTENFIDSNRINHDRLEQVRAQDLFKHVTYYCSLLVKYPNMNFKMDLFHKPLASWEKIGKGKPHFHGHLHSKRNEKFTSPGRSMDVGLEGNGYNPYNLREAIKEVEKRPITSYIKNDHH